MLGISELAANCVDPGGQRKNEGQQESMDLNFELSKERDLCVCNHELIFCFEGCLGGRLVHVFGAGFSPGNISAAVCGAPCQVLANATVSAFSCLVLPLDGVYKCHIFFLRVYIKMIFFS